MHNKFRTDFDSIEQRIELLEKAGEAYLYSDSFAYKYCKSCYKAFRCYLVGDIEHINSGDKILITLDVSPCSACSLDVRTTHLDNAFPPKGVRTSKSFPIYTLWEG